jgi:hypothetical protein
MPRSSGQFNGQISGPSAGLRKVRVKAINQGLDIISSSDSEGRTRRAFYSIATDSSGFVVVIEHISYEEREDFNQWLARFMDLVSNNKAKNGVLTVRCPARNFVRNGVCQGTLEYGEGLEDLVYSTTLAFLGASDPTLSKSYYKPAVNDAASRFFYPAAQQIKGAESTDDATYGDVPDGANFQLNPTLNKPDFFENGRVITPFSPTANKPTQGNQ